MTTEETSPTSHHISLAQIAAVKPRHAREIKASNWSVGAETMDRDYTIYRHWREYLGPLGAKKARIQAGWAKTEKQPGVYDWAWLDEIIPDMVGQGVEPWVCLCYGNPLYGGEIALGTNPPEGAVIGPWLRFVDAFVERYGEVVDAWEVWNEPRVGAAVARRYTLCLIRTAETIRKRQPHAKILAFSTICLDMGLIDYGLALLKEHGKLDLVDEITYHPYATNPDICYKKVEELRTLIRHYSNRIAIRQGENGISSQPGPLAWDTTGPGEYSEHVQAKWATRRMFGDLGRDIPTSLFTICDIHYKNVNQVAYFGLLETNPDQTVHRVKPAYYAMQNITAVFDDKIRRIPHYPWYVPGHTSADPLSVFGYTNDAGKQIVTIWKHDRAPSDTDEYQDIELVFPAGDFEKPVYVDVLTGGVYDIPAAQVKKDGSRFVFKKIPVYDSVVLIADLSLIPV